MTHSENFVFGSHLLKNCTLLFNIVTGLVLYTVFLNIVLSSILSAAKFSIILLIMEVSFLLLVCMYQSSINTDVVDELFISFFAIFLSILKDSLYRISFSYSGLLLCNHLMHQNPVKKFWELFNTPYANWTWLHLPFD